MMFVRETNFGCSKAHRQESLMIYYTQEFTTGREV